MSDGTAGLCEVHRYSACGLSVASEIALPGLVDSDTNDGPVEITIRQGQVPMRLAGPLTNEGPNWQHDGQDFLLRVPGVGRFLIEQASAIRFEPEGDHPPEELTAFLTGSVMGLLLHLRGHVVLHGSAMLVGGKAVMFCGQSGAGKSTLAAALGKRGYTMLSDDLCAIAEDADGNPIIYPDGRKHKLWQKALEKLSLQHRQGDGVRHQLHKYYVEPGKVQTGCAPLAALYELREARAMDAFEVEDPSLADAALIVRRNAFRPRIMWKLGQKTDYFRATARIANSGGVHVLKRPLDFSRMDDVLDKLEEHWRSIGLLEQD